MQPKSMVNFSDKLNWIVNLIISKMNEYYLTWNIEICF